MAYHGPLSKASGGFTVAFGLIRRTGTNIHATLGSDAQECKISISDQIAFRGMPRKWTAYHCTINKYVWDYARSEWSHSESPMLHVRFLTLQQVITAGHGSNRLADRYILSDSIFCVCIRFVNQHLEVSALSADSLAKSSGALLVCQGAVLFWLVLLTETLAPSLAPPPPRLTSIIAQDYCLQTEIFVTRNTNDDFTFRLPSRVVAMLAPTSDGEAFLNWYGWMQVNARSSILSNAVDALPFSAAREPNLQWWHAAGADIAVITANLFARSALNAVHLWETRIQWLPQARTKGEQGSLPPSLFWFWSIFSYLSATTNMKIEPSHIDP